MKSATNRHAAATEAAYEIELTATNSWAALRRLTSALPAEDVTLEALRCSAQGHLFCRIRTNGLGPEAIRVALEEASDLQLDRLTVLLQTQQAE